MMARIAVMQALNAESEPNLPKPRQKRERRTR
jgi:hypothetical protein